MGATTSVVIGGASGMGLAVAERFAGRGPLVVADRDAPAADAVARRLGDDVTAVGVDVTDRASVDALAAATGRLGALVHTAGLSPTMACWPDVLRVNFVGTANVLSAFVAVADEGSSAVCFASIAAHRARPDRHVRAMLAEPFAEDLVDRMRAVCATGDELQDARDAYALSKWGVLELVRRAAVPWAARGARVMALSPGIVDTPMGRRELDRQPHVPAIVERSPLRRKASPREVADVVEFLCSPRASFMTGSEVLVDGGYIAVLDDGVTEEGS